MRMQLFLLFVLPSTDRNRNTRQRNEREMMMMMNYFLILMVDGFFYLSLLSKEKKTYLSSILEGWFCSHFSFSSSSNIRDKSLFSRWMNLKKKKLTSTFSHFYFLNWNLTKTIEAKRFGSDWSEENNRQFQLVRDYHWWNVILRELTLLVHNDWEDSSEKSLIFFSDTHHHFTFSISLATIKNFWTLVLSFFYSFE